MFVFKARIDLQRIFAIRESLRANRPTKVENNKVSENNFDNNTEEKRWNNNENNNNKMEETNGDDDNIKRE